MAKNVLPFLFGVVMPVAMAGGAPGQAAPGLVGANRPVGAGGDGHRIQTSPG